MFAHRKQMPGAIEPGLDSELVRRQTEDRLELADKVKRRDVELAREIHDRRRRLAILSKQVASPAEAPNPSCLNSIVQARWILLQHAGRVALRHMPTGIRATSFSDLTSTTETSFVTGFAT